MGSAGHDIKRGSALVVLLLLALATPATPAVERPLSADLLGGSPLANARRARRPARAACAIGSAGRSRTSVNRPATSRSSSTPRRRERTAALRLASVAPSSRLTAVGSTSSPTAGTASPRPPRPTSTPRPVAAAGLPARQAQGATSSPRRGPSTERAVKARSTFAARSPYPSLAPSPNPGRTGDSVSAISAPPIAGHACALASSPTARGFTGWS